MRYLFSKLLAGLALAGLMASPAIASCKIVSDNFNRSNSTTVGNSWVNTYSTAQISSDTLTGRHASTNQAATTLNGGTTAGTSTVVFTNATGYVAGDVFSLETGTSNVEYCQISVVATNTITTVSPTVNSHLTGVTITKIRDQPLMRPIGEAVQDLGVLVKLAALTSTAFRTVIYERWINAGTWDAILINWNGTTQFQTQIEYSLNGTVTATGTENWTGAVGMVVWLQASTYGVSPTNVDLKVYSYGSGLASPISGGTGTGQYTTTITAANDSGTQTTGQNGLGFADAIEAFSLFEDYNKTGATVAASDTNFAAGLSPFNWASVTSPVTGVETTSAGAYAKFEVSGVDCTVTIDTAQWQATPGSTYFAITVDEGAWQYVTITAGATTIPIFQDLLYGNHTVRIYWREELGGGTPDLWTTPTSCILFTGLSIDNGESTVADAQVLSKTLLYYTDSIGLTPASGDNNNIDLPYLNHIAVLANALGCEYGNIDFGGQGFSSNSGAYNVPNLFTPGNDTSSSWDKYSGGVGSRLVSGALSPAPNYIFVQEGTNDSLHGGTTGGVTSSVSGLAAALRAAAPSAPIYFVEPFGEYMASSVKQGVINAADSNTYYLPLPASSSSGLVGGGVATWASGDGLHPLMGTEPFIAAALLNQMYLLEQATAINGSITYDANNNPTLVAPASGGGGVRINY